MERAILQSRSFGDPSAKLAQNWPKNEAKLHRLRQSRRSNEIEIIGFLSVDLLLLGPYP